MPKRIDMSEWLDSYKRGTAGAGTKWRDKFLATSGIADAAKSDDAQDRYVQKMSDPDVLARRQRTLQALSDEDFKRPVRQGGAALYTSGTSAKAEKARDGFAPYATVINDVVAGLPAKAATGRENVMNRVLPIVEALEAKKREG